jgi:hypothetical protein
VIYTTAGRQLYFAASIVSVKQEHSTLFKAGDVATPPWRYDGFKETLI